MLGRDQRFEPNPYSPRLKDVWHSFLEKVKNLFADTKQPTCFISYAWPPAGKEREQLHDRLINLKRDLEIVGATIYLDITNLSSNINAYMDKINDCDYVILIGTPKLKARLAESGDNNAKYEYERIQQKLTLHPDCCLPLMFEGDFDTSFPSEISQPILIRDCRLSAQAWSQGRDTYMHTMSDFRPLGLLPALYQLSDSSSKYPLYQVLHQQMFDALQQLKQAHEKDCDDWYQKAHSNAVSGDYRNAFSDYQQAANRLHAPACYRVGFFYHADDQTLQNARPVPQDEHKAFEWFLRGAQFGHVKSMMQVAERLAYRGREQKQVDDFTHALHWVNLAVQRAEPKDQRQATQSLEKVQRIKAEYLAKEQHDPQSMCDFAGHLLNSTGGIEEPSHHEAKRVQLDEALKLARAARQNGYQEADVRIDEIQHALEQLRLQEENTARQSKEFGI